MKKILILTFLLLPACAFAIYIGLSYHQLISGQEVRIKIEGYDPRGLLTGHYILYQNNGESVVKNTPGTVCKASDFSGSHKFYIPQTEAARLDRLFGRGRNQQNTFEIVYSCVEGKKPIAKQLLIDGMDWHDFLKKEKNNG